MAVRASGKHFTHKCVETLTPRKSSNLRSKIFHRCVNISKECPQVVISIFFLFSLLTSVNQVELWTIYCSRKLNWRTDHCRFMHTVHCTCSLSAFLLTFLFIANTDLIIPRECFNPHAPSENKQLSTELAS